MQEYGTSWGVLMLSPVAGALAAAGGLLLVRFLADPDVGVLGELFRAAWDAPSSPVALALALLFGFSGRLFSSYALAAAGHATPPTLGAAPASEAPAAPAGARGAQDGSGSRVGARSVTVVLGDGPVPADGRVFEPAGNGRGGPPRWSSVLREERGGLRKSGLGGGRRPRGR